MFRRRSLLLSAVRPRTAFNTRRHLFASRSKVIRHTEFVRLKGINGSHKRWAGIALKPSRRAPAIIASDSDQSVMNGVLMNIIQPGQIGLFESQFRIPKLI